MIIEMIMPQMGESVVEGTITKWLKTAGEKVQEKETLLEISTDKVDSEIPAPKSGVLVKILISEGQTVPVGTKIALIDTEGVAGKVLADAPKESSSASPASPGATKEEKLATLTKPVAPPAIQASDRFYSPLVKNIAKVENVSLEELERIPGTGAEGRVTKNDMLTYLEQKRNKETEAIAPKKAASSEIDAIASMTSAVRIPSSGADQIVEMDHVRRKIAEHMVFSKKTSPHVNTISEADMTPIVKYRESMKETFKKVEGVNLTYTAFFIHATARALKDFPGVNASVDGTKIILRGNINVGMAVALPDGNLIVPIIKNADQLNLVGLAHVIDDLTNRARQKKLKPDEVMGGTFTVTNMGTFGSLFGTPIINQPQVGILGIGAIKKRVIVTEEDALAIRSMVYLNHAYDHRVVDGSLGGMFLQRVVKYLEEFKF